MILVKTYKNLMFLMVLRVGGCHFGSFLASVLQLVGGWLLSMLFLGFWLHFGLILGGFGALLASLFGCEF